MEFYGTEEDAHVIARVGDGYDGKVRNLRVFSTALSQDRVQEIFDADKDEFGLAKSSVSVYRGHLGIGTTEPKAALTVMDEVGELEEFPSRAMTDYETYMEGHGVFRASASEEYSITIAGGASGDEAWKNFDKASTNWTGGDSYTGTNNTYAGTHTSGGYGGDYIELQLPYKIRLQQFILQPSPNLLDRWSKSGVVVAKNTNDDTWTNIFSWSGSSVASADAYNPVYFTGVDATNAYDTFRLVITSVDSQPYVTLYQWRLFGTREQGASTLHNGELTLTRNLTVPRIGPPLDADDTPRRDRLVVEYNTSTNNTENGVVKDTSGRGLDGLTYNGASYDATEKALVFDGSNDYIKIDNIGNPAGGWAHSFSAWFKLNDAPSGEHLFQIGNGLVSGTFSPGNSYSGLNFTSTQTQWYFFSNDYNFNFVPLSQTWYHIVGIYPGGSADSRTLYVNGVKRSVKSGTTPGTLTWDVEANSDLAIGADWGRHDTGYGSPVEGQSHWMEGSISQFKLYDVALTADEVKRLYDMGRCDEGHHVVNFSKTRVGIGLGDGEAPRAALDVRDGARFGGRVGIGNQPENADDGNAYPGTFPASSIHIHQNNTVGEDTESEGIRFSHPANVGRWNLFVSSNNHFRIAYNGVSRGYVDQTDNNAQMNFTGQHRTFIKDTPFTRAEELEGLIVSSDQNKYIKMSDGIEAGSNAITTNESLPIVSLSNVVTDKKCFGVISSSEDPENRTEQHGAWGTNFEKEKGDTRVYINSVGEGAIWVVNTNGSLESGDYITTSNVTGYGQKQDGAGLMNYTVAKITMDCDFNPATQPIQCIKRSNVVETHYTGLVPVVKSVPHEFVTTVVSADDAWSNVSISPSDVTYAEWSNLEANVQNTYTLEYTSTSNVVYDVKYTKTTVSNVTGSDPWDAVHIEPPTVTYAEYSNLEANVQNTYSLTYTMTTKVEATEAVYSNLSTEDKEFFVPTYYHTVEQTVDADYPGAVKHETVTDRLENDLDEHGQIQWEDHPTDTEKAYKIRYLTADGTQTDEANAVHIAAFVGCTYHCG